MQPTVHARIKAAATASEEKRPTRTKVMVETAIERGMLQKRRSTRDRWRKLSRLEHQPAK